ncbi:MAG: hypothetical protein JETT_2395 [Candidatus Jettenia ecosi]|uniref:Uncharacterized protein n=1 Tax=Candidatus Jettenia ecosi TaxID=2494326 RepID=A0A533Q9L2_9BACT|nr:MAG: hypothetical protein JETT_2395 [Candidatus Jettenia ecosi]
MSLPSIPKKYIEPTIIPSHPNQSGNTGEVVRIIPRPDRPTQPMNQVAPKTQYIPLP